MAFPLVAAEATSAETGVTSSHTVALPTGIVSGHLLKIFFAYANKSELPNTPEGWTLEQSEDNTSGAGAELAIYLRIANGSEGSSVTITTTSTTRSAHISQRITGHESTPTIDNASGGASQNNSAPDPPPLTPSGGAIDYLFQALGVTSHGAVLSDFPTNYTNGTQVNTGGTASLHRTVAVCRRNLNTSSEENPSAWSTDTSAAESVSATIAIHPAGGPVPKTGTAAGSISMTGAATGARTAKGQAAGVVSATGAAEGKRRAKGTAAGTIVLTGAAAGQKVSAAKTGTAAGTMVLTGAATGKRIAKGAAAGTIILTGAGAGVRSAKGTAAGLMTLTGAAEGKRRAKGTAAGSIVLTGTAAGSKSGVKTGTASGTVVLIGAATGHRTAKGQAAGAIQVTGAAAGKKTAKGTAAGVISLTGAATGKVAGVVTGTAAGTVTLTGMAVGSKKSPPGKEPSPLDYASVLRFGRRPRVLRI